VPTTPNRGYRYPSSTDDVRPYEDIQFLATDVDTDMAAVAAASTTVDAVRVTTAGAYTITATDPSELVKLRSASIGVVNGALYRFHGQTLYTAVTDGWTLEIRKGSTSGTIIGGARFSVDSVGGTMAWDVMWPCALTETTQFFYTANRLSGTGTLSTFAVQDGFNNAFAVIDRVGLAATLRDVA
jgi:hypothetical protein